MNLFIDHGEIKDLTGNVSESDNKMIAVPKVKILDGWYELHSKCQQGERKIIRE